MKKVFLLLIGACGAYSATAQTETTTVETKVDGMVQEMPDSLKPPYKKDPYLSRFVIDVNFLGGALYQDLKMATTYPNYRNQIEAHTGKLKMTKGMSFGGDVQFGYFFGQKGHWGIGTGLMYLMQQGDITQDSFRVQYQSADANGGTFRQVTTANGNIVESQKITNVNIPLVAKYKYRFTKHIGFTADAGIFYNLQIKNEYTVKKANFDYEGIYQFRGDGTPVYDPNYYPGYNDWLITEQHMTKFNPLGVGDSMNYLRSQGYNVGLNQDVYKKTGTTY
jgi:hypothetical protein